VLAFVSSLPPKLRRQWYANHSKCPNEDSVYWISVFRAPEHKFARATEYRP